MTLSVWRKKTTGLKTKKRLLPLVLAAALCSSPVWAEEATFTANFKDTDLKSFIETVGANLNKTIIMGPGVQGKVSIRTMTPLNERQYYQLFLNLLEAQGYAVVPMENDVLKVVKSSAAKVEPLPLVGEGSDNYAWLIIYPTDTMYAIGCHGLKERAIERICKLKNIDPRKNNLSIICYDLSNISEYAKVDNSTFKLMKRNLPGPFTFILNTGNRLPKIFKNRKEVGIRVPDNNIIREICHILKAPIMTTTLPLKDGEDIEYITTPELIEEKFGKEVELIIDGGIGGIEPSTIVNCTNGEAEIVRQGKGILNDF